MTSPLSPPGFQTVESRVSGVFAEQVFFVFAACTKYAYSRKFIGAIRGCRPKLFSF